MEYERRQEIRCCAAVVVITIVTWTGCAIASGGELPEKWRTLTIAAARLHYRDHVPSRKSRTQASEKCLLLSKDSDTEISSIAAKIVPLLKEVVPLEIARLNSGMAPRDQRARGDRAVLELLFGVKEYPDILLEGVDVATTFARANDRLLLLEAHRSAIWTEHIRPRIAAAAGAEQSGKGMLDVKFGLLSRDIWISVKNVGKVDLTNCSFATVTHHKGQPDLKYVWFFPSLEVGQTVCVEPYHSFAMPRKLGDEFAIQPDLSVEYTLYCDQCRILEENAASVNGYEIRDPFVCNLVSKGREWVSLNKADKKTLHFESVKSGLTGRSFRGDVEFTFDSSSGSESFTGSWTEDRATYRGFHPGLLDFFIYPKQEKAERSGLRSARPTASGSLRWIDGRFSLIKSVGSDDFVPLEDN